MKNLTVICLFAWCLLPLALSAQVFDHTISFGFNTISQALQPLGNGNWIALGRAQDSPGALYADEIVLVMFDAGGNILLRKTLPVPSEEVRDVIAATGAPDGSFAVSISRSLCDVATGDISLLAFDPDGQLRWEKHAYWGDSALPAILKSTPDGNLIGVLGYNFVKYDMATGEVLFEAPMQMNQSYLNIYDLDVLAGTENIVAVGYPHFQYWEKKGQPDAPVYQLSFSNIQPQSSVRKLVHGPSGEYYTMNSYKGELYRFTVPDLLYSLVTDYPFSITDMAGNDEGLFLLPENSGTPLLYRAGFNGQLTDTIALSDTWQNGLILSLQDNTLAIAGISGSGPAVTDQPWLYYNANQMWLHTRPLNSTGQGGPHPNASLSAVAQAIPVAVNPYVTSWGKFYDFSGGQFSVQVTNSGPDTLRSIDILIGYEWVAQFICYFRPANRRHFSGLAIAPGDAAWLDFGDISAVGQSAAPAQLCFWTAAPNEQPDADHSDDVFCHSAILDAAEPNAGQMQFAPNPCSEGFWVEMSESAAKCDLFDTFGRLVRSKEVSPGADRIYFETQDLPNGIYYLGVNRHLAKVVVQHK